MIEALGLGRALILFPRSSADLRFVARLLAYKLVKLKVPKDDQGGSFIASSMSESIR